MKKIIRLFFNLQNLIFSADWKAIIFALFLAFAFLASNGKISYSQQELDQINEDQTLSLTIVLLPETVACRPRGYVQRCRQWTPEEVDRLLRERGSQIIFSRHDIPPGHVSIGDSMFNELDRYISSPRRSPAERKSVLTVFDFGSSQGSASRPVSISLTSQTLSTLSPIRSRDVSGLLRGYRNWIDHERADAFYPGYEVSWTLCLGGSSPSCENGKKWTYTALR